MRGLNYRRNSLPTLSLAVFFLTLMMIVAWVSCEIQGRVQVPDATSLRMAAAAVQEVYRDELARAKTSEQKRRLAEKLLGAGTDERNNAPRFALWSLARDTAANAGDFATACRAIDQLDSAYQIDRIQMKSEAALAASRALPTAESRVAFVHQVDPLVREAALVDRYDSALRVAELGLSTAKLSSDPLLMKRSAAQVQQVKEQQSMFEQLKAVFADLAKKPTDPELNLKVGRFRCLTQGNWDLGLPLLAGASDQVLKQLSAKDLAGASTPEMNLELADGWWDFAQHQTGIARTNVLIRAGHWYGQASRLMEKGLARAKAEKRLAEISRLEEPVASAPITAATGKVAFGWTDLPRAVNLRLVPTWERWPPHKTLQSMTVTETLVLTKQDSPYLVTGYLVVNPGANLTIAPGAVVLFAADAQLNNKGTITMESEGEWIVLAPASVKQKWKGISSRGHISARRCLLAAAQSGIFLEETHDGLTASECIFAGNDNGLQVGNHSWASISDCLLFKNKNALMTDMDGLITFSKCLMVKNTKGFCSTYFSKCNGSQSTFLGNEIAIESGPYGDATDVHQCNILGSTKMQAHSQYQGSILAHQDYWGEASRQANLIQGKVEAFDPLTQPIKEALPKLPSCEYLSQ